MGIPRHTRIILIPEGNNGTREYGITREAVLMLGLLVVVFVGLIGALMVIFADKVDERRTIAALRRDLAASEATVAQAAGLANDLEDMRRMQEQLLVMLGVEGVDPVLADSLAAWAGENAGSTGEALRHAAAVTLSPGPERWPAAGPVTREFNPGNVARGVQPHLGLDIAGSQTTPVVAAAAGTVARTGHDQFLGNFVEIQHGLGYLTVYGHCSRLAVGRNARVEAGQVIAYMGHSGQASATHLHFEIWHQGEAVDPRSVLTGDPPSH